MMAKIYNLLAFDLGASNGRAILGRYDGQQLSLTEVHKFTNGAVNVNGALYWDIIELYSQIITGLQLAAKHVKKIDSIAIDTWGVDYGLLDANDQLLANPYMYRDSRTDGLLKQIEAIIPAERIYELTGIQFMQINTLVQLYADKVQRPWILENAKSLLFIPDLLNFFLTGKKYNEYTDASTSQLFNPTKTEWASELFEKLGLPQEIMGEIIFPGDVIGNLTENVKTLTGIDYDIPVIAVGSHDTASAVAAAPLKDRDTSVYISSGTWSLLGMELDSPMITEQSRTENFTNETGVQKTIRFLKNISGLWLIQECKKYWDQQGQVLSYSELAAAAQKAPALRSQINPDDPRFLNPDNMPQAIQEYCRESNQPVPNTIGEISRCIYESLAASYETTITRLEAMVGKKITTIHMVGGGIQAEILCQFTANATNRQVVTGPIEATAIGNMLVQLMAKGEIADLEEGRELVKRSIEMKEYLPQ